MRTMVALLIAALVLTVTPTNVYLAERGPESAETPLPLLGPESESPAAFDPVFVGVTNRWLERWQSTWW